MVMKDLVNDSPLETVQSWFTPRHEAEHLQDLAINREEDRKIIQRVQEEVKIKRKAFNTAIVPSSK